MRELAGRLPSEGATRRFWRDSQVVTLHCQGMRFNIDYSVHTPRVERTEPYSISRRRVIVQPEDRGWQAIAADMVVRAGQSPGFQPFAIGPSQSCVQKDLDTITLAMSVGIEVPTFQESLQWLRQVAQRLEDAPQQHTPTSTHKVRLGGQPDTREYMLTFEKTWHPGNQEVVHADLINWDYFEPQQTFRQGMVTRYTLRHWPDLPSDMQLVYTKDFPRCEERQDGQWRVRQPDSQEGGIGFRPYQPCGRAEFQAMLESIGMRT